MVGGCCPLWLGAYSGVERGVLPVARCCGSAAYHPGGDPWCIGCASAAAVVALPDRNDADVSSASGDVDGVMAAP